jgi:hypothetical protein
MQIYNAYNLQTAVLSFVLAFMYFAVLIKVHRGSKFRFVYVISSLMLVSNLTGILVEGTNYEILGEYAPDKTSYSAGVFVWIIMQAIFSFLRDSTFNVAHWEFAFKYFKISIEVPQLLNGVSPDDSNDRFFKVTYYSLLVINILVALLSSMSIAVYNWAVFKVRDISQTWIALSQAFKFSDGGAQLISGFVLIGSLVKISRELRKNNTGD